MIIEPPPKKKVLIVEDHADIRRLVVLTLEFEDYELHEAANGVQGWEQVQALRPDLVLLDVMMPGGVDGLMVCRRIRQTPDLSGCKVVLLTARGMAHDIQAGYDAGADAYLVKPFSPLTLIDTLERLLK